MVSLSYWLEIVCSCICTKLVEDPRMKFPCTFTLNVISFAGTLLATPPPQVFLSQSTVEDQYIKVFGNSPDTQFWDMARVWDLDYKEPRLKRYCSEAHKQAGFAEGRANNTILRPRVLIFENPKYIPRMVDVVMYGIMGISDMYRDRFYYWLVRDDYWYITEGQRDDCVYYLKLANKTTFEFSLERQVCGIYINLELDPCKPIYK